MINQSDIIIFADFCRQHLDLAEANLGDEYFYQSLPLCVIDAVFSIGANYASTAKTVIRFCEYFNLPHLSLERFPNTSDQLSISEFIDIYRDHDSQWMADHVYKNRQRTSTRSGILKSEAVLMFSKTLMDHKVDYYQDVENFIGNESFEADIKLIPGQGSGISLKYFYMLAGSDDYVKPDRMVARFIWSALQKSLGVEDSQELVVGACSILSGDYPNLTPRSLDHLIWKYQRDQG